MCKQYRINLIAGTWDIFVRLRMNISKHSLQGELIDWRISVLIQLIAQEKYERIKEIAMC
jgi:hypothetical protein